MNHRLLPIRATAPLCIFTLRPCGPAPEVRSSTSLLLVMIRILELPGGHRRRNAVQVWAGAVWVLRLRVRTEWMRTTWSHGHALVGRIAGRAKAWVRSPRRLLLVALIAVLLAFGVPLTVAG